MTEKERKSVESRELTGDVSRRDFIAMSVAAGVAATAVSASAAMEVVESDVEVKTPDGTCDAAFIHPKSGSHPGVIIWSDAFGLRPSMRGIGKRISAEGYSVLVPNPFYRVAKAPAFQTDEVEHFNFQDQSMMAKLRPLMGSISAPGAAEKDATAFVAFLDSQHEVNKKKKIGTQGYCMGGPLVVRTCAAAPDRLGAGASFHGGGLVTDKPDSPHLKVPQMKAQFYFAIAMNDDQRQPDAKTKLAEAFKAANLTQTQKVYEGCNHGWCVKDMPNGPDGKPLYNEAGGEEAWGQLVALYKRAAV